MSKFAVKNIEAIKGKLIVKQLVILDDAEDADKIQIEINKAEAAKTTVKYEGVLDEYEKSLNVNYQSSFNRLLGLLDIYSNLQLLPHTKFKDVTIGKDPNKEYEFKHGDLRLWAMKIPHGALVIFVGYKNQQQEGFSEFRKLKTQYLNYLAKGKK